MSLLTVRNVVAGYGKAIALDRVSLNVEQGDIVTLIGTNGAGKSTLMKVIMGFVPALAGEIEFDGQSLSGLRTYEIARRGIAYVPEGRGVLARAYRPGESSARRILAIVE